MFVISTLFGLMKEFYTDRRLLISLAAKDFQRRFAGSFFGRIWGFVNPLLTIIVYFLVFKYGFKSGEITGYPFVVWFVTGIIVWLYFAEAFTAGSNAFLEYSYLVKKVVFNIDILPMVKIISCLFIHGFFIVIAMILCVAAGIYPSIYWLQIPYYLLCTVLNLFAVTLFMGSILVFFRDLNQIIGIILLMGMWGTPIAWDLSQFPESTHVFFKLNPIFYLVDGYRDCFLSRKWFWEKYTVTTYFWVVTILLMLLGSFVYNRLKHSFANVL